MRRQKMGVTLQAAIETYHEAEPHQREHWWTEVSQVCFGKDYELSGKLEEVGAQEGWPTIDIDDDATDATREPGDAYGLQWMTGDQFVAAVKLCEEPSELARGVVAMLGCFSRPTRLLFWRE